MWSWYSRNNIVAAHPRHIIIMGTQMCFSRGIFAYIACSQYSFVYSNNNEHNGCMNFYGSRLIQQFCTINQNISSSHMYIVLLISHLIKTIKFYSAMLFFLSLFLFQQAYLYAPFVRKQIPLIYTLHAQSIMIAPTKIRHKIQNTYTHRASWHDEIHKIRALSTKFFIKQVIILHHEPTYQMSISRTEEYTIHHRFVDILGRRRSHSRKIQ